MKIIVENVGDFCSNDPHVYQACWVTSQTLDRGQLEKTNDERLCANCKLLVFVQTLSQIPLYTKNQIYKTYF